MYPYKIAEVFYDPETKVHYKVLYISPQPKQPSQQIRAMVTESGHSRRHKSRPDARG